MGSGILGVWLFATVAAATPQAQFVHALVKIRPGDEVLGSRVGVLSAARSECEGIQLHVRPPASGISLEAPPLEGSGAPLAVSLFTLGYVDVSIASNSDGATGLWPDPLLPLKPGAKQDSTSKRPLVFYARVCVPEGQAPGTYETQLSVTSGETKQALPLKLEVQPFTLPATSSLPNTFGLSRYSIAKGHGVSPESETAHALLRAYAKALLEHRLSAYGMGVDAPPVRFEGKRAIVDWSQYDEEMAPFLEGTLLDSGARFTTSDLRKPSAKFTAAQRIAYYRAFAEHFREKGWKTRLFYYAKDEPRPEDFAFVREEAKEVHAAGKIDVLVTAPITPGLTDVADILAPVLNCFFERDGMETCEKPLSPAATRRALGGQKRVFWYQSCMSHGCGGGPMKGEEETAFSRWVSYMVDQAGTKNRAMGPLAFLTGVDGELYFDSVWLYNEGDPWKSMWDFGGNGDGTLFYPGTPERTGAHEPILSIRLEHIRDGLEDYEYLKLAATRGAGAAAQAAVRGWVKSGYEVSLEPSEWERVRSTLTRAIRKGRE